jgi:tetratricopeptide (TPR) repeat protein
MKLTAKNLLDALEGKLNAGEIAVLTRELRSLPHEEVLGLASEARINIDGDGNIIGNNNVSFVIKCDGSLALAESLRQHFERDRSLYQLRAPVPDFTGRDHEIQLLTDALCTNSKIVCVSGMAGVGKTELALIAANIKRADYPDAQLFIELGGGGPHPVSASDALITCIHSLHGMSLELPTGLNDLTKLYRTALNGKRALILIDDASDENQVRPLIPPPGNALIITSRNRLILPGLVHIALKQLAPMDGIELLLKIAPRVSQDVARQICRLCGYLPLAVRAAGSLLAVTEDLDPAYYASQLENERTRLERLGEIGVDIGVKASLNLSYDSLPPDTARVLRLLSVFPLTFDSLAEETVCEDPAHGHLTHLVRRNLVLFDSTSSRYSLHDLIKIFTARLISENEKAVALRLHARYYLKVATRALSLYVQGATKTSSGLRLFDSEWENIRAGQAWAAELASEDVEAAELCVKYPWHSWILLSLRQTPRMQIEWVEQALAAALQQGDRYAEGACYSFLGSAYSSLGEIRTSIKLTKRYLDVMRELGKREDEGGALKSIGRGFLDLGKYRRSIIFLERALSVTREVGDRRTESSVLLYLGQSYAALGDTERALQLYEQGLRIARETENLWNQSAILGSIGNIHLSHRGNCALQYYEEALSISREIGDRKGEAASLNGIGKVYTQIGHPKDAMDYFKQALEIHLEFGDQVGISKTYGDMGLAHSAMDDHRCAIEFYERQLTIAREIGDKQSQADCLGNMADSYLKLDGIDQAIMLREQSLTFFREMGAKPRVCSTTGTLGYLYRLKGDIDYSITLHDQRIALAHELGHNGCLAESYFDRSLGLAISGRYLDAIESAKQALHIFGQEEPDRADQIRELLTQWEKLTTEG